GSPSARARARAAPGAAVAPPAERGGDPLRDRRAEAGPTGATRDERAEQPLLRRARDARPGVLDGDVDRPVLARELERHPAAVGRCAERVREEVPDDLEHAVAVGDDHGVVANIAAVVDLPPLRLVAVALER